MNRTITEIEADLKATRKLYDSYNNLQNEGATDGYNPHMDRIDELADELGEAKKDRMNKILSGDSLAAERAAFNKQGFKAPNKAQEWCLARGYQLSDLMAAAKAAK